MRRLLLGAGGCLREMATTELLAVLTFRTAVPQALVAGIVVWTMACGGGSIGSVLTPTPTAAREPAAVGTYEGTWIGRTNQGERVEFTVTGTVVSRLSAGVTYATSECTGGAAGGFGMAAPITAFAFAAISSLPIAGFAWSVDGRFTSPREATGTFKVTFLPRITSGSPPCVPAIEVSWTAEKHS
jgi:hypothetical protein